ncbi:MAG: ROK family protein, partial [Candidatus Sumerlaeota bacterium]|nr:ROK family protein [Candidatus Sumerlaeota bacterium]
MNEHVIGIDLGGTKVLSAVVDASFQIVSRGRKRTQKLKTGEEVFERLVESAREAAAEAQIPLEQIAAIGVGAPGPLNPDTGIVEVTPNMGFRNFPLRDRMQEALGRPAFVNNDVNLGTF